jgi:sulfotransferase family protein
MHEEINKPIFVVGSPRSGTSILAWCLGYHPNIFPVPESAWMGDFAVNVAMGYQVGAARGILSVLSAMGISRDEFFSSIGRSINSLLLKHRGDLDRQRLITAVQRLLKEKGFYVGALTGELDAATSAALRQYGIDEANGLLYSELVDSLRTAASDSEYKTRWVDQTPQYSFHICGLRKLFPHALFIHIVRDVTSVVRSMLNFHRVAGTHLVTNEEEAYRYWLLSVRACLKAEEGYGPHVVYRVRYSALVENPPSALRSLLDFVGEPYSAKCLEPLSQRINSSNVPDDFRSEDPATDPVIIGEAMRLSRDLQHGSQPTEASAAATAEMEAAFEERVQYIAALDSQYQRALQNMQKLERAAASESDILQNVPNSAKKPIHST